ncbi:EamA-like transporter family protein [Nitzschia inconspicua]|uniref:EamA-like transporter family protein n=1 Tax=Nitzschia inconspicua TaxID=303405 RepID=A0A9K3LAP4_9STRA|nr:EamA-like transporter family protein [Nitzschia inconspicua]
MESSTLSSTSTPTRNDVETAPADSSSKQGPTIINNTHNNNATTTAATNVLLVLPSRQPFSTVCITYTNAAFYVLSGCSQPLIMTLLKQAGIADASCQSYMLFYYLFPASFILPVIWKNEWPQRTTIWKACGIATWDIMSTSMNYTGASLAGPTIFAIIYSSVTIWTAVFSQILLGRTLSRLQWITVMIVFAGLALTATDSLKLGQDVAQGSILVMLGSAMHALTYVLSEAIMTRGDDKLNIFQNTGIQGSVAAVAFLIWQIFYTVPNFHEKVWEPMQHANTTIVAALGLLVLFGLANLVHSITFFHTLLNFPGGATSAGVMKGLQAVLVFLFTDLLYCDRVGGTEMCFSRAKFLSLVTVCGGVLGYGVATEYSEKDRASRFSHRRHMETTSSNKDGQVEIEPLMHNESTSLLHPDG